jgi:hypothetical protein
MSSGNRGRPYLGAGTPADSQPVRLRQRIAWLLRVSRLYGTATDLTRGGAFAAAFPGGCHPGSVSESKISRWENGRTPVPRPAIQRYEQLLGLPPGMLVSTADLITRHFSPPCRLLQVAPEPVADGDRVGGSLDEYLEQACSADQMNAAGWDQLTGLISLAPGLRLRRREWDAICQRLLVETIVADGEAWKPRFEAYIRLLAHPDAQRPAAAACAAWVACPDNRVFIEPVSLLDACCHPDASAAVLRQLCAPTNDDAFAGALLACVRKVAGGHFSDSQLRAVAGISTDVLSCGSAGTGQLRAHATAVLDGISAGPREAAGQEHPPLPALPGGPAAGLIAARSRSLLPREIRGFDDHVLAALIGELLHHPIADRRLYAAFLIQATPYRGPVASSLAWALRGASGPERIPLATRLLEALRILGRPEERPEAERLTSPARPLVVRDAAFQALSHMGGRSDVRFWRQATAQGALAEQATPRARRAPGSPGDSRLLDHAVYAIGIQRDLPELRRISAQPSVAAETRAAARWWLSLPEHMVASAEH